MSGILALVFDVLFVGHSLVGPSLPRMVEGALDHRAPATVQAQVINGAPLAWNWDNGAQAQGVDGRAVLAQGGIDALVLTEAIPLANHLEWSGSEARAADWAAAAWAANPAARVLVYETWHSLRSGPGVTIPDDPGGGVPWRARLTSDLPAWERLVAAAEAVRPPTAPPVRLVPAGQAMGLMADAAAAGQVPGVAGIGDMFADDIHPNGQGLYFLALVHAAALTEGPVDDLPLMLTRTWASRDAVVTEDQARVFRRIAWQAVSEQRGREDALAALPPDARPTETVSAPTPAVTAIATPDAVPDLMPTPQVAALGGVTVPGLAMNLAPVNDWSTQLPFLDLMKSARPWIAHRPGAWGGWDHAALVAGGHLSARGWPLSLPQGAMGMSTLVLTDLPPDSAPTTAGRYAVTWQGRASLRVEGRGTVIEEAAQSLIFDFEPGPGGVILTLSDIDPADPIRDIAIVRQDRQAAHRAGALFNPDFLARLRGVTMVRFMDWGATNGSTLTRAADRPVPGDAMWTLHGVPLEVMVALANELGADPWFCLPHLAEDALVTEAARIVRDTLAPGLRAHVEHSNEVWNWAFPQAEWAAAQAQALWGTRDGWVQAHALRAAEAMRLWSAEFGAEAPDRLVRVLGVQTGWLGLEAQMLDAPLAPDGPRPRAAFDAYAVTGYVAAGLGGAAREGLVADWLAASRAQAEAQGAAAGLTGDALAAHVALHRFDLATEWAAAELASGTVTGDPADSLADLLERVLPHHAAAARQAGLRLVMYEGGTHVAGSPGPVEDPETQAFFAHLNYSAQMGDLMTDLRGGWAGLTDAPFAAYLDVQTPTKWGSWGTLRHLSDDNPRWRALARGCPAC